MNTTDTVQKRQDDEALKRFTLISPLLSEGLDDAGHIAMRKQITVVTQNASFSRR